jgi:hypothetical protein
MKLAAKKINEQEQTYSWKITVHFNDRVIHSYDECHCTFVPTKDEDKLRDMIG